MTITMRLPWPPSVNSYLQTRAGLRGKYISKAGKRFRSQVVASCSQSEPLAGRLSVSVELTPPDRRKRDLDNHIKAALDAMEHAGVYENDEQIDVLLVKRLPVESPGACDVTISEIQQARGLPDWVKR